MIMKIQSLRAGLICAALLANVSPVLADGLTINFVSRTDTASTNDSFNGPETNTNSNNLAEPWNDIQTAGDGVIDSATAMQNSDVPSTSTGLTFIAAMSTVATASAQAENAAGDALYDVVFFLSVPYQYSFSASADGNAQNMIFTLSNNDTGDDVFDSFTASGSGVLAPGNYELNLESKVNVQLTDSSGALNDFNDLNFSMTLSPVSAPEPATNVILASICCGFGLALSWLRVTKSGRPRSTI